MNRGKSWNARLKHYGPDSTRRSGVRRFPCTLWPSIKKSANAKSAAPMQANVSFLELPVPNTPSELRRGSCPVHSSPGGESAQSLVQKFRGPLQSDVLSQRIRLATR